MNLIFLKRNIFSLLDINECEANRNPCPKNSYCNNKHGGYSCICNDGYTDVDGIKCIGKQIHLVEVEVSNRSNHSIFLSFLKSYKKERKPFTAHGTWLLRSRGKSQEKITYTFPEKSENQKK